MWYIPWGFKSPPSHQNAASGQTLAALFCCSLLVLFSCLIDNPLPVYYIKSGGRQKYFDGGLLQLIGWRLLGTLITVCTCGICYPWAVCMVYGWETKHTVVNGHRLTFDGSAVQLFGNWIKWFFLTIITLGIYGFWLGIALRKWKAKHTHFAN